MERSFSHLLRTSRLATFDKNIAQIYTTTGAAKAIGDWGLKRNLPVVLRTHLLDIEQLDTAEHQTPFQSASSDYLFIQRWKENFPRSRPPQPQPLLIKKDLATMTDVEFKKLLQQARDKKQEWKDALANNDFRSTEHLDFLNISSLNGKSPTHDFSKRSNSAFNSSRPKVGPTYGFYEPSTPVAVQGRGLNHSRNGNDIGVCGVVASLPSTTAPYPISKSLDTYYVVKAELEADGRPNVILSRTPVAPGSWLSRRSGLYNYNSSPLPQGATSTDSDINAGGVAARKVVSRVHKLLESHNKSV
ncbi:hypothetical protein BG011_001437 [Mortierella polycephala]|uniref:Uncharacterized protein n=1 Tax=Mortierella polycephala TaxID=41804 RepID=A0A9P6Q9R1_9FUNG|nr:hypothetical protein BG011_001437 [Mortierella polycephala]